MANPTNAPLRKFIRPPLTPGGSPAAQGIRQLQLALSPDYNRPYYAQARPLEEALSVVYDKGLPFGESVAKGKAGHLEPSLGVQALLSSPNRDELLSKMRQLLLDQGVEDAAVIPLAQGAESFVFATPDDRVVKFGTPASRFTYSSGDDTPQGVWGVLPITRHSVSSRPTWNGFSSVPETWDLWMQPKAMLGVATRKDLDTLKSALDQQGWSWNDDHMGNIGMLPGKGYRPVVIDGDVVPSSSRPRRWPFVPPTGPVYSVAGAAAAGAAAETQRDDQAKVMTQRQLREYLDPQPLSGLLAR